MTTKPSVVMTCTLVRQKKLSSHPWNLSASDPLTIGTELFVARAKKVPFCNKAWRRLRKGTEATRNSCNY